VIERFNPATGIAAVPGPPHSSDGIEAPSDEWR